MCTCIGTSASKLQVCDGRGLPAPPPKGYARSVARLVVAWDMLSTLQEVLLTISCSKDVSPALPRLYARHRLSWSRYLRPQHTFPPSPWTQLTLRQPHLYCRAPSLCYTKVILWPVAQSLSLQQCSSNGSLLRSCSPAPRFPKHLTGSNNKGEALHAALANNLLD